MSNSSEVSINIPETSKPRVIIIGGGFGGLYAAQNIDSSKFQVVLFDKRNYHTFQPLLYQVATSALQSEAIVGPLRSIFKKKNDVHFRLLRIRAVDPDAQTVETAVGKLHYDYLIIANGCKSNFFGNDLMEKYALPVKSIPDVLNIRSHMMQTFETANLISDREKQKDILNVVVVGGGPTGVEVAGAISELRSHVLPKDYPNLDFSLMNITVVQSGDHLLNGMTDRASQYAKEQLEKMGVTVNLNCKVTSFDGKVATLSNGETINTYTVIWSAGVKGDVLPGLKPEWIEKSKIKVDMNCRVIGSDNIFAIGDIASQKSKRFPYGMPGVAQPAIQMGTYVAKNLDKFHNKQPVKDFDYFDKGSLATIGRGKAVCDLPNKKNIKGRIAWWIWAFIHIAFLVSFRNRFIVFVNWIWNYLTFDKGNRLIIRPYIRDNNDVVKMIAEDNNIDDDDESGEAVA